MNRRTGRSTRGTDRPRLYIPPMDPFAAGIAAAIFRHNGYDARVLPENAETLAVGLRHTGGGECAPFPSTLGALIAAVQHEKADPGTVSFFMPTACGPCRFGQYAQLARDILDRLGWERLRIVSPGAHNAYAGLGAGTRLRLWRGMLCADLLRAMTLRVRPYEAEPGAADRAAAAWLKRFEVLFAHGRLGALPGAIRQCATELAGIPTAGAPRPRIGVVGEIYVRFSPFLNDNLCRRIEQLGGEVRLAPMHEWVRYAHAMRGLRAREYARNPLDGAFQRLRTRLEARWIFAYWERHDIPHADPLLQGDREPDIEEILTEGRRYLPPQFAGEAILTLGRAALFVKRDGCRAIINAAPAFCMPGTIAASIFPRLESELGVPVLSTFYDGTGDANAPLSPLLHSLCRSSGHPHAPECAGPRARGGVPAGSHRG